MTSPDLLILADRVEGLLPCPFCGGPAVNVGGDYITCGAGWNSDCAGHTVQADRDAWNTRSPDLRTIAANQEKDGE